MKVFSSLAVGVAITATTIAAANSQPSSVPYDPSVPQTRAQVKAELAEWRAAGFDPLNWLTYPSSAIKAGRIVAERRAQGATPGQ
jgi:hypothetical protein